MVTRVSGVTGALLPTFLVQTMVYYDIGAGVPGISFIEEDGFRRVVNSFHSPLRTRD